MIALFKYLKGCHTEEGQVSSRSSQSAGHRWAVEGFIQSNIALWGSNLKAAPPNTQYSSITYTVFS